MYIKYHEFYLFVGARARCVPTHSSASRKNSGERIVRLAGDALEWRKGNGKWSKEHTILRQDVVSVKVVDPQGKTLLVSTRTGLLTLRTLSEPACQLIVTAIESWVKGAPVVRPASSAAAGTPALKRAPAPPSNGAGAGAHTSLAARIGQRLSLSFKRSSVRGDQLAASAGHGALPTRIPQGQAVDYSFASNHGGGGGGNLGGDSYLNDMD